MSETETKFLDDIYRIVAEKPEYQATNLYRLINQSVTERSRTSSNSIAKDVKAPKNAQAVQEHAAGTAIRASSLERTAVSASGKQLKGPRTR